MVFGRRSSFLAGCVSSIVNVVPYHQLLSASQTSDSKKEEFRKYLEKSGVIDALTKVLVGLYEEPERPANAVDYVKRYMGASAGGDSEALKRENEELKQQLDELKQQLQDAKKVNN